MPAGSVHDRITLWSLPLVTGYSFWQTRNSTLTLLVASGFLFGGLMFGPDLDVRSCQYRRWGWLRWIWIPYQQFRHRSLFTHGPVIGTALRLLYLTGWLALLAFMGTAIWSIVQQVQGQVEQWQVVVPQYMGYLGQRVWRSWKQHPTSWLALVIGLELGAMSHSFSDWLNSARKRIQKTGWGTAATITCRQQQHKLQDLQSKSKD
ncbi:MAG: metal-binding protein [Cyanobacteria bacterium]|nr:metal-binding protein [Cyanobacteriota bacterium]MDW8202018.1 metal-binding protein [Cyanobacteriota bacterium SKYGB_h_bin112]